MHSSVAFMTGKVPISSSTVGYFDVCNLVTFFTANSNIYKLVEVSASAIFMDEPVERTMRLQHKRPSSLPKCNRISRSKSFFSSSISWVS